MRPCSTASHRSSYLKSNLLAIETAVLALTPESAELHLLHQYQEQLSDSKRELGEIRQTAFSLGAEEVETSVNAMDKDVFDCSLQLKKLLFTLTPGVIPNPKIIATIVPDSSAKLMSRRLLKLPPLRDGSGRELHHLHDAAQHQNTMFEWRRSSQETAVLL